MLEKIELQGRQNRMKRRQVRDRAKIDQIMYYDWRQRQITSNRENRMILDINTAMQHFFISCTPAILSCPPFCPRPDPQIPTTQAATIVPSSKIRLLVVSVKVEEELVLVRSKQAVRRRKVRLKVTKGKRRKVQRQFIGKVNLKWSSICFLRVCFCFYCCFCFYLYCYFYFCLCFSSLSQLYLALLSALMIECTLTVSINPTTTATTPTQTTLFYINCQQNPYSSLKLPPYPLT